MELARKLEVADEFIDLSRHDPGPQLPTLLEEHPYGFDVVVEATGSAAVLQRSISAVRRGGKLLVYGVYGKEDVVTWSPAKICEIPSRAYDILLSITDLV